ncbi:SPOR domain-containing protein [Aurantiacibacter sp. MUD11]|uniref:SPOR domain-containing protein n=1 Tax=Aurantiacibacter sp. MUD11 TaxID=3003265 RepID=UPI0022AA806B|nr:SPOR domain-containing protein [Aurantiacibacter sp. MUD11]WAT19167.1 SPOR domain-containing protein [Aurantiacibacter sp. MUD11]
MSECKRTVANKALLALAALALATPLSAGVRDGVDAWARGDYAAAVAEWQGPAEAGDPDAMFNLGQAYRLGRGVPTDLVRAEQLYLAAAQAGHVQAADTYGLMLFQDGRREEALPYVQSAANRGDPRAQYLLGVAHFNGDLVERDWVRAYALLTLANGSGLPQAAPAIAQMDEHIPLEQRQSGAAMALQLEQQATEARSVELAAADLGAQAAPAASVPSPRPMPQQVESPSVQSPAVPRPIPSVEVSPSVAAARDAVEQAGEATGTEDPAMAGASYAPGATQVAAAPPAASPRPAAVQPPQPAEVARAPSPRPAPAPVPQAATPAPQSASGPWRVQLGAFGVPGNAERMWDRVANRPEVAGRERMLVPTGRVTRVLAGGYATRAEATAACSSLQRAGFDCLVTRN